MPTRIAVTRGLHIGNLYVARVARMSRRACSDDPLRLKELGYGWEKELVLSQESSTLKVLRPRPRASRRRFRAARKTAPRSSVQVEQRSPARQGGAGGKQSEKRGDGDIPVPQRTVSHPSKPRPGRAAP